MTTYEFTLILAGAPELTDDLCDAFYAAGCDDSSPYSSEMITYVPFDREAGSLETAINSAIADVQKGGCQVERLEMDTDELAATLKV